MDGLKKKNLQCCTIERTSDGFWKIKLLELVTMIEVITWVCVCIHVCVWGYKKSPTLTIWAITGRLSWGRLCLMSKQQLCEHTDLWWCSKLHFFLHWKLSEKGKNLTSCMILGLQVQTGCSGSVVAAAAHLATARYSFSSRFRNHLVTAGLAFRYSSGS